MRSIGLRIGWTFFTLLICILISLLVLLLRHTTAAKPHKKNCNLFRGNWIEDETNNYPLYNSTHCPFIEHEFNCQRKGRLDKDYLKYRWKPHGCSLTRYALCLSRFNCLIFFLICFKYNVSFNVM